MLGIDNESLAKRGDGHLCMERSRLLRAQRASELLFTEFITGIPVEDVLSIFEDVPSTDLQATEINSTGIGVVDLIARVGLAPSKSEARRLVQSGGVYVNNRRITDPQAEDHEGDGDRWTRVCTEERSKAKSFGPLSLSCP